jgi:hypothetical protein
VLGGIEKGSDQAYPKVGEFVVPFSLPQAPQVLLAEFIWGERRVPALTCSSRAEI